MKLHQLLTIVIPCKNEGKIIDTTLNLLNNQENIEYVKVIVCDSSDDYITRDLLSNRTNDKFNLVIANGGLPSIARNIGFDFCNTPYVLFMDADVFILDYDLLTDCLIDIKGYDLELLTCKFRSTTGEYNGVFRIFDTIQKISKPLTPFALGGFMLIKSNKFIEIGKFNEKVRVAEDYMLSKKISSNKFKVYNSTVFTTPRRFKSKGLYYMLKLMINSIIHRDNENYFENDNNYWK
jgi:glycosyltransferase involved in cell wall biosynthesis